MKIYSIYDRKMNTYSRPMFLEHIVEGIRSIQNVLRTEGSLLSQYPGDYDLYELGEWSQKDGAFNCDIEKNPEGKPIFVMSVNEIYQDLKKGENNE